MLQNDGAAPKEGGSTVQAPPEKEPEVEQACVPLPNTEQKLLLSLAAETWQSLHLRVSLVRTVWGTCGLKAWLLYPGAEIGGCCM